jgi:hypothetical protein
LLLPQFAVDHRFGVEKCHGRVRGIRACSGGIRSQAGPTDAAAESTIERGLPNRHEVRLLPPWAELGRPCAAAACVALILRPESAEWRPELILIHHNDLPSGVGVVRAPNWSGCHAGFAVSEALVGAW